MESEPKPKAKAKAKSKGGKKKEQTTNAKESVNEPPAKPKPNKRGKDSVLEKLDLKRRLIVLERKRCSRVEELNAEVTISLEAAAAYKQCEELMGIVKVRLERMFALLSSEEGCSFPKASALGGCDTRAGRDKLSPISSSKMKALQDPSKAALQEYDKLMTSADQSVQKAITLLNKTATELQVADEKERAKEKRLAQIRARQAKEKLDAVEAAKKAGEADADAEASDGDGGGEQQPGGSGDDATGESDSDGEGVSPTEHEGNSLCSLEVLLKAHELLFLAFVGYLRPGARV